MPRKLAYKNKKAKDNFGNASTGNMFRVAASNLDEIDRLKKTKETAPDTKFTPRKTKLPTKNTDAAGVAATKRRRLNRTMF
jgi:hypothetical protein